MGIRTERMIRREAPQQSSEPPVAGIRAPGVSMSRLPTFLHAFSGIATGAFGIDRKSMADSLRLSRNRTRPRSHNVQEWIALASRPGRPITERCASERHGTAAPTHGKRTKRRVLPKLA